MKNYSIEKWSVIRKQGFFRFLLVSGILKAGLPMFLVLAGLLWLLLRPSPDVYFQMTAIYFVVALILGCLTAFLQWRKNEKVFDLAMKESIKEKR